MTCTPPDHAPFQHPVRHCGRDTDGRAHQLQHRYGTLLVEAGATLPGETAPSGHRQEAVLTADETTTEGGQRARPNAYAEAVTAHHIGPERLAILREDQVEIPSNLQARLYA